MKVTIPVRYRKLRAAAPFDSVSLGYHEIHLAFVGQLEEAQRGYSSVPGDETMWDPDWVVIGSDDMCGDPIFIDTADEEFPVYTAEHGAGEWRPRLIAFSFQHLLDILEQFRSFRGGCSTPVELKRRPITSAEREHLLSFIRQRNPDIEISFWEDWLADYN